MISKQQAEKALRRLFNGGIIERLPKKHIDVELILALTAASFDTQLVYTEYEVDEHLIEWLEGFTCPIGMDYMTIRRNLVDHKFLIRNASGTWYKSNQTVISKTIELDARQIQPRFIWEEVQREREKRKLDHTMDKKNTRQLTR